jgi:hypothetical protein
MTDIEAKALALVNEVQADWNFQLGSLAFKRDLNVFSEALSRALEQHEAFKQKVSDIVYAHVHVTRTDDWEQLKTLIIPKPKPDPLVEALEGVKFDHYPPNDAKTIRAALDALGFEVREKGQ